MAVEDRAKELNSLAEKIQGSFANFRSQFKSISNKRKRIRRNITERKKRDAKLKSSSSSFGKSIGNIKSKVLSGPSSILGKVLNFASLLLFGVAINAIAGVNRKVDDDSKMMKENSENTGNFITGMVAGIQNFIAGFGLMEKKVNNTFDDVDKSINNAEKELQEFKGEADKLDNFDLANILTDSTPEDDDKTEEESIDSRFKTSSNKSNLKRNADKTDQILKDKNIELVKTEDMTSKERQKAKFTKRLFKQLDANELNIDNLQLDSELEDIDGDGVEERIIIIRQKEIIKQ
mgnify:CR=1 FL=1|tara:strand:+ start:2102 stop:2974 length:873 start_codon:yes stop_codon:yes gene_type:complete